MKTNKWRMGLGAAVSLGLVGAVALWGVSKVAAFPGPPAGPGMMAGQNADQHFIIMMIPHHEDAIAMADLALTKAERPEIRTLATNIKATQTAEIEKMRAWYETWYGTAVPDFDMPMEQNDLAALNAAQQFDRAFIEQMVPHHVMAVQMSQMLLPSVEHPELKALLQSISTSQQAEIDQMRGWYQSWYGTPLTQTWGHGPMMGQWGGMHGPFGGPGTGTPGTWSGRGSMMGPGFGMHGPFGAPGTGTPGTWPGHGWMMGPGFGQPPATPVAPSWLR